MLDSGQICGTVPQNVARLATMDLVDGVCKFFERGICGTQIYLGQRCGLPSREGQQRGQMWESLTKRLAPPFFCVFV